MRMLDKDLEDLKELAKVTEDEALEFLNAGVPVVCRIRQREFIELKSKSELEQCKNLKSNKIYDMVDLYIE